MLLESGRAGAGNVHCVLMDEFEDLEANFVNACGFMFDLNGSDLYCVIVSVHYSHC